MSSLFNQASLVIEPAVYEASKLYATKPFDGSGDLTFTRTLDTATRVGPDGLIEKVRTNLSTFSSDFASAGSPIDATITTNTTTDPFGTSLADSLLEVAVSGNHLWFRDFTVASGVEHTYSIFVKSIGGRNVRIAGSTGTGSELAVVNLANGAILASTGQVSVTSSGNGWYRISVTTISTGTTVRFIAYAADGTSISYAGDITKGIFLFGQQLETGVMTPYIPTTTAAVSVGMLANVPRLDYEGGGCPKLLLEPQRSNLNTFSEQLDNAAWTKQNTTITANATTSPDGFVSADKFIATAANSFHAAFNVNAVLTGNHTFSFYAKKAEYDFIVAHDQFSGRFLSSFNLNTGAVVVGAGSSMQSVGNGWYRCIVSFDGAGAPVVASLSPSPTSSAGTTYLGDGTSGVFVWGCQLEAGSYPTSYIPTLGAAVTRSADSASKTGISALIGQTEGTLFVEVEVIDVLDTIGIWLRQSGSLYDNIILMFFTNARNSKLQIVNGGVSQADLTGPVVSAGFHKIAAAYKANDFVLYVDGVQVGTDTSGSVPTCDEMYIDQYIDGGARNATKKSALLFPTRLTNGQLAELTA